ncbi:MAG: peptide ABC transporter permease [Clostridiales bacterium 41_21_two_genomes]|nr:MAG: peptide ABC transporter permease [Clostridiales bacterium 41_21_two_genomes]
MKRYLKNKSFLTGAILAFIMLGMLVVSLFWLPYDPEEMYLAPKLSLPSISHLMGTDQFGRDVLSRIGIGVVVVVAGGLVGTLLGACSGYFGGYVDEVIMKIVDAQMAFPGILLALMLMCIFGRGLSNTILALSIMSIPRFVRMARSGFLKLREADFVKAERVRGASAPRIMFLHILPNLFSELTATASLTFASAVMSEAGLSYLGLGVAPPKPSLGLMLSDAQQTLLMAPWNIAMPAIVITLLVMSFNLIGDGIQEVTEQ